MEREASPGRGRESGARGVFALGFFPLVLGGALGGAIWLIGRGTDPGLALLATQVPAYLVVISAERLLPFYASWKHSKGDLRTDTGHLLTIGATSFGLTPLLTVAATLAAVELSRWVDVRLWPQGWHLGAQLALALVVGEFFQYWVHRLQHTTDFLWRFHATHHSAPRLYWLNAARFHPLDIALNTTASHLVLIGLGCGPAVIALHGLFSGVHGILQHCNLPLRLGPLNYVFSMAELHRWHHSRKLAEANHNYGQNLILWDIVFGTRFLPAGRRPPEEIGIEAMPGFPSGYWAQQLSPFRWQRVKRESAMAPGQG
ncbi:MAG: sterol desaturase family protein [Proteobacteria bacterium]|nr:sterol desaturase family protein [Pseudomonadota bacterium]